jgi:hypothetical protein
MPPVPSPQDTAEIRTGRVTHAAYSRTLADMRGPTRSRDPKPQMWKNFPHSSRVDTPAARCYIVSAIPSNYE